MSSEKDKSNIHEQFVADAYGGERVANSGAGQGEKGDVALYDDLVECKCTGGPGEAPIHRPTLVKEFEKIADHAWASGREPVLALRYYLPDSPLADASGYVDLSVRRLEEDALARRGF